MKNQVLKISAIGMCSAMLVVAGLTGSKATARTANQTMTGACPAGYAVSLLEAAGYKAGMMATSEATMAATMDMAMTATTEATMDMAMTATTEATMDMAMTATTEATMDMAMTATTEATMDATMAAMTEPACLVAVLSGAAEVPGPGDADGYGIAAITVDPTNNTVTFDVAVSGITLPAAMAHIHIGAPDVAGPVVIPATDAPNAEGLQNSTATVTDAALVQDLLANPSGYYYNVHTSDFPAGAMRGNLVVADAGMMMMGTMDAMMATAAATAQ